ncbi:adrenodoxin-like protein 2, mitochondrial isoform X2 [Triticum dicoccoides]|uniref:adrenodoxin-like protein 2, mitochondrial isoform X2 n=1 Tax=Triticum dicoccoides TaxID=85692 RepID=UPI00189114FE|nr:adrenodoxin-like protein 2, mitochondrial isoform X2 [Triticum dicoccoides]
MLSRISRLGVHALSRARLGQKSVNSRNQEEPIRACMNYVGNHSLCSATGAKVSDRSEQPKAKISVTFVDKDGDETVINVPIGMSMLEAAHENDIELEGACEGSLACSTCHVIVTTTITNWKILKMRKTICWTLLLGLQKHLALAAK